MKYKSQPYLSKQCGQTCLAMITGKSIKKICKALDNNYTTNIYTDLQEYLNDNGYRALVIYDKDGIKWNEVPNSSIIRLKKPCGGGHYIVKHNNEFYDPATGIVKVFKKDYTISHYLTYENKAYNSNF